MPGSQKASSPIGEANSHAESGARKLFDYESFFGARLNEKRADGSYRYFKRIARDSRLFPVVEHHKVPQEKQLAHEADSPVVTRDKVTIWCSNDYLGLGVHPHVKASVCAAVEKYGSGSGGTRNISGSAPLHYELERELARLHEKPAALLFTSCYVANDTTLYTLAKLLPGCQILSDAGNHASMIQGIRNSGVPKHIFRHNDCEHLEQLLARLPRTTPKIVAFESVHSMDGSIGDMARMCDLAHEYGALAFVDEVSCAVF